MTASVLLEGVLKDGEVENFTEIAREAFKVTRAYDGCIEINLTLNVENRNNFDLREYYLAVCRFNCYCNF